MSIAMLIFFSLSFLDDVCIQTFLDQKLFEMLYLLISVESLSPVLVSGKFMRMNEYESYLSEQFQSETISNIETYF